MSKLVYLLLSVAILGPTFTALAEAQVKVSTIAFSGQPAAELGGGVTYSRVGIPNINGLGQVAFTAVLQGTGIDKSNDEGVWAGAPGSLQLVAREGSPAPD